MAIKLNGFEKDYTSTIATLLERICLKGDLRFYLKGEGKVEMQPFTNHGTRFTYTFGLAPNLDSIRNERLVITGKNDDQDYRIQVTRRRNSITVTTNENQRFDSNDLANLESYVRSLM